MHLGFELFYTTPRQIEKMSCRVCGTNCDVQREVYEPANIPNSLKSKIVLEVNMTKSNPEILNSAFCIHQSFAEQIMLGT